MFAKGLPFDFKNHNYLYNMVKTNKHIKNSVTTDITTDTDYWLKEYTDSRHKIDTEYCILFPALCTDSKEDKVKEVDNC